MRVLLIYQDQSAAQALQWALPAHFETRLATSIRELVRILRGPDWVPDAIVSDLKVGDPTTNAWLAPVQKFSPATPLLVGRDLGPGALRRQLEALHDSLRPEGADTSSMPAKSYHQPLPQSQASSAQPGLMDMERIAGVAAEAAVSRAIDQLTQRLGLDDPEGVRLAIRLARAWEAAKTKFFSGLATGVASAFLVALGAGLVALVKNGNPK